MPSRKPSSRRSPMPPPGGEAAIAWWDQKVYFDGVPTQRRDALASLSANPEMTGRAARLFLETAKVAFDRTQKSGGGKGEIDPDGQWITVGHHHIHTNAKGEPDAGVGPAVKKLLGAAVGAGRAVAGAVGHQAGRLVSHLWGKVKGKLRGDEKGKLTPDQIQKKMEDFRSKNGGKKSSKSGGKLKKDAGVGKMADKLHAHNAQRAADGKKPSLGSVKVLRGAGKHAAFGHLLHAAMNNHKLHDVLKRAPELAGLRKEIKNYHIHVDKDGNGTLKAGPNADPAKLVRHMEKAANAHPEFGAHLNKALGKSKGFRKAMTDHIKSKPSSQRFEAEAMKHMANPAATKIVGTPKGGGDSTEAANKSAHAKRQARGEKLGDYAKDVDYTKPMGKGKSGGDSTDSDNKAAHADRQSRGEKLGKYAKDVDYTKPMGKASGKKKLGGGGGEYGSVRQADEREKGGYHRVGDLKVPLDHEAKKKLRSELIDHHERNELIHKRHTENLANQINPDAGRFNVLGRLKNHIATKVLNRVDKVHQANQAGLKFQIDHMDKSIGDSSQDALADHMARTKFK